MKLDLSEKWCMKMAELEDGHEVGAGMAAADPGVDFTEQWACVTCSSKIWLGELIFRGSKPLKQSLVCPKCGSCDVHRADGSVSSVTNGE